MAVGDILMLSHPLIVSTSDGVGGFRKETVLNNGEQITVESSLNVNHISEVVAIDNRERRHNINIYLSTPRYKKHKQELLNEAKRTNYWKDFYDFSENFVVAKHLYSMTVHKAQGSTFEEVYIDYDDIVAANPYTASRLLYVALSRAKSKVIIYKGKNDEE